MTHDNSSQNIEDVINTVDRYTFNKNKEKSTREQVVQTAKGVLRRVYDETRLVPQPSKTSKGGVRLEYYSKKINDTIEIEIYPDGETIGTFSADDTEPGRITLQKFLENIHKYMGIPREDQTVY